MTTKPTDMIIAAFQQGETVKALDIFDASGGDLFAFRYGYDDVARILDVAPQRLWSRHENLLGAYILYLAKQGRARRAQALLKDPNLTFVPTYRSLVYPLILAIHLGDPISSEQLDHWMTIESRLPDDNPLLEGLYYNCVMVYLVRHGRVKEARTVAQRAIAAYQRAGHIYLEHFIHLHLADLSIAEGRFRDARRLISSGVRCLTASGTAYGNEQEIIEILNLALDYEMGKFDHIPSRSAVLLEALIMGDSWTGIFEQLARISVKSTFFLSGRDAALADLELFRTGYAERHGGTSDVLAVLEASIDKLDWRFGDAAATIALADMSNLRCPIGQILLQDATNGDTIFVLQNSEFNGPRHAIVSALKAAQDQTGHQRRRLVEQAFWLAVKEGHTAPFLEHRDVLSGIGARLSTGRFARGHVQLSRMARRAVRMIEESYWVPETLRKLGVTRRQIRVATALQSGATNKEIARSLAISEATVKFHLASLFRKLNVHRRGELLEKIHEI